MIFLQRNWYVNIEFTRDRSVCVRISLRVRHDVLMIIDKRRQPTVSHWNFQTFEYVNIVWRWRFLSTVHDRRAKVVGVNFQEYYFQCETIEWFFKRDQKRIANVGLYIYIKGGRAVLETMLTRKCRSEGVFKYGFMRTSNNTNNSNNKNYSGKTMLVNHRTLHGLWTRQ